MPGFNSFTSHPLLLLALALQFAAGTHAHFYDNNDDDWDDDWDDLSDSERRIRIIVASVVGTPCSDLSLFFFWRLVRDLRTGGVLFIFLGVLCIFLWRRRRARTAYLYPRESALAFSNPGPSLTLSSSGAPVWHSRHCELISPVILLVVLMILNPTAPHGRQRTF
jgi:hypothetical protein